MKIDWADIIARLFNAIFAGSIFYFVFDPPSWAAAMLMFIIVSHK